MLLPGVRVNLNISEDDAWRLRCILGQTACPGSFQAQLIVAIDAAVEDVKWRAEIDRDRRRAA